MNFFRDCNGFTESEVNKIMSETSVIRKQRESRYVTRILVDSCFYDELTDKYSCISSNNDRSIFLLRTNSEPMGCDLRDRYFLYIEGEYYFFSIRDSSDFLINQNTPYILPNGRYFLKDHPDGIPIELAQYSQEQFNIIYSEHQYHSLDGCKDQMPGAIAFYYETPCPESKKEHISDIIKNAIISMGDRGFTSRDHIPLKAIDLQYWERLYLDDVLDFGTNTFEIYIGH